MLKGLKQYTDIFTRGLTREVAPRVAASMVLKLLKDWNIDRKKITTAVKENKSLWDNLTEDHRKKLNYAAHRIGNLSWITPEWFIDTLLNDQSPEYGEEFTYIASLFLNWPEAYTWLVDQVEELKTLAAE